MQGSSAELSSYESGERTRAFLGQQPVFLQPDFLVFFRDNVLWATRLDPELQLSIGSPQSVESGIDRHISGEAFFALSRTGDLVYRKLQGEGLTKPVWVSRSGEVLGHPMLEHGHFYNPIISLDGREMSMSEGEGLPTSNALRREQWRLNLETGARSQPAQLGKSNSSTQWVGPDGAFVIFSSDRDGIYNMMYIEPTDGSGAAIQLFPKEGASQVVLDASPDGRFVLFRYVQDCCFSILDRETGEAKVFPETEGDVDSAAVHPKGLWYSFSTGNGGIWMSALQGERRPIRLTEGFDTQVRWSPKGDELYYRGPTHVMSISVKIVGDRIETGPPQELFEDRFVAGPGHNLSSGNWDVHPDGRFLFFESASDEATGKDEYVYVQNWVAKWRLCWQRQTTDRFARPVTLTGNIRSSCLNFVSVRLELLDEPRNRRLQPQPQTG